MASGLVSYANLASGATVTASTEDANYPGVNATMPEKPLLPWRTTAIGADQTLVIDTGAASAASFLLLVGLNYTSATLQANAADSWGAPAYDSGVLTIGRCPWTQRYQGYVAPAAVTQRYWRLVIPAQTPTDGAAYFSTGGLWIGAGQALPSDLLLPPRMDVRRPIIDVQPRHQGWRQRLRAGEPVMMLDGQMAAQTSMTTPGVGDALATWLGIEQNLWEADYFAFALGFGDASQAWVMRVAASNGWTMDAGLSTGSWTLEEVLGP